MNLIIKQTSQQYWQSPGVKYTFDFSKWQGLWFVNQTSVIDFDFQFLNAWINLSVFCECGACVSECAVVFVSPPALWSHSCSRRVLRCPLIAGWEAWIQLRLLQSLLLQRQKQVCLPPVPPSLPPSFLFPYHCSTAALSGRQPFHCSRAPPPSPISARVGAGAALPDPTRGKDWLQIAVILGT